MSLKSTVNSDMDDYKGFYDELQKETPRAAVIIAAAFMDDLLRRLLENIMVDDPKVINDLLGSEKNADRPLSSFSARIKAAYCLGLLSKQEYGDLNLIRSIRNRFAHRMHGFTFDDPDIVKWCSSLRISSSITSALPHFPNDHRSMFLLGVTMLVSMLSVKSIEFEGKRRANPKDFGIIDVVRINMNNQSPTLESF